MYVDKGAYVVLYPLVSWFLRRIFDSGRERAKSGEQLNKICPLQHMEDIDFPKNVSVENYDVESLVRFTCVTDAEKLVNHATYSSAKVLRMSSDTFAELRNTVARSPATHACIDEIAYMAGVLHKGFGTKKPPFVNDKVFQQLMAGKTLREIVTTTATSTETATATPGGGKKRKADEVVAPTTPGSKKAQAESVPAFRFPYNALNK